MEKQYVMTTFILLATLTMHYYTIFWSNLSLNEGFKFLKQLDNRLINFKNIRNRIVGRSFATHSNMLCCIWEQIFWLCGGWWLRLSDQTDIKTGDESVEMNWTNWPCQCGDIITFLNPILSIPIRGYARSSLWCGHFGSWYGSTRLNTLGPTH